MSKDKEEQKKEEKVEQEIEVTVEEVKEEKASASAQQPADTTKATNKPEADVKEKPEETKVDDKLLRDLGDMLTGNNEKLEKLMRAIESQNERMKEIESKLPQEWEDPKVKVDGYFDFDTLTNKMLNESAASDYEKAKADFSVLRRVIR